MEILTVVLKPEQRDAGLYLTEDDDFLYLKRGDKVLAVFSAYGATILGVQREADKHLN
jgi:hypothetical protein